MKKKINILHMSPYFNYVCGVSKYVYLVLKELKKIAEVNEELNLYFITNEGDSFDRLMSIGINPIRINFKKGILNLFYFKNNIKKLVEFCLSKEIDIIHTHHRYLELLSSLVQKKIYKTTGKKIKTITTVHSLVKGYKKVSFKSDKIIVVSRTVKEHLFNKFEVPEEKIILLSNPIENDISYSNCNNLKRSDFSINEKSKILLFVGRFCKEKGVDILLKAFNEIAKTENLYLFMITDVKETIKNKIAKGNRRVIFINPLQNIEIFYRFANIVVLPSLIESSPYVIFEAALNRKLLIVSNIAGIKEFIEADKDAIMFKAGDHISLKNAIKRALNISEKEEQRMIENMFLKTKILNNPYVYTEKLLSIYEDLLKH